MRKKLLSILALTILLATILAGCGQASSIPPALTILSITEGHVFVMKAGADDWTEATSEMSLEVGDTIKTGDDSGAEITFFDGSTIELEAGTQIEIASLDSSPDTGTKTITLMQTIGTTISRVTKLLDPASTYAIETPTGVAAVRGSMMIVQIIFNDPNYADGTVLITNLEGHIWAIWQGVELQVPEGRTCVIRPGQLPELIPLNNPPVAISDSAVTDADSSITVDAPGVLVNDSDPDGDTLAVTAVDTSGTVGTVTAWGPDGSFTYDPDGQFEYLPAGNSTSDSFTYTVSDGHGGIDTATVTITINGVNDAPTDISLDNSSVAENQYYGTAVGDFSTTDPDTGDAFTYSLVSGEGDHDNAWFMILGSQLRAAASFDYETKNSDSIRVRTTDSGGLYYEEVFIITVTDVYEPPVDYPPVNNPPLAVPDAAFTDEDNPVTVAAPGVLNNDSDPDVGDTLTMASVDTTGTLGAVTAWGANGSFTYNPNGKFEHLPAGNSTTDSFTYTVSDGHGGTATAAVTITINGVNDPPVAVDDGATTSQDTPVTINVLTNDSDPDGDTLTVNSVTQGIHGSVTNNGSNVTYTPALNFTGTDSFTYTISDGNGGTATAAVTVTVAVDIPEPVSVTRTAYVAYEDREHGDFDYNDFCMTMFIEETYAGDCLTEINMQFNSVTKLAGDVHDIHILRTLSSSTSYNYTITRTTPAQGTETSVSPASGQGNFNIILFDTFHFTAGDTVTIHIEIIDGCEPYDPAPWAYYDPYMNNRNDCEHHIGDAQPAVAPLPPWPNGYYVPYILVIPVTGWQAPAERQCITSLYPYFDDYYATGSPENWYE